jgi:Tfp pilus assembly protein PilF
VSIILDALRKAQEERRRISGRASYGVGYHSRRGVRLLYLIAGCSVAVALAALVLPFFQRPVEVRTSGLRSTAPTLRHKPSAVIKEAETSASPSAASRTAPHAIVIAEAKDAQVPSAPKVRPVAEKHGAIGRKALLPARGGTRVEPASQKTGSKKAPSSKQGEPSEGSNNSLEPRVRTSDQGKLAALYNEAVRETEKGNYDRAKRLYEAILVERPDSVEALNNLGVIAMEQGNTQEAMSCLKKALSYGRDYGKAYNNLGLLMMKTGDRALAEEYLRKAVEIEQDVLEPSLNLAALLREDKRHEEAGRLLEGLVKRNMKDASLYLSLAVVKDEMGQYDHAIRYYRDYLHEYSSKGDRNRVIERIKLLEAYQSSKGR